MKKLFSVFFKKQETAYQTDHTPARDQTDQSFLKGTRSVVKKLLFGRVGFHTECLWLVRTTKRSVEPHPDPPRMC
ncbi:hypothetical protein CHM34_10795 [Paludifilum halophilum]|uniref:Uncharacterized protein n=1 Tax=Paludifilum halophilum TaxID=1642702 RepID=A0A235B5Y2_9BACL|nr:hypothetical protein CHM34_10795 [Paludifilum halophilum]